MRRPHLLVICSVAWVLLFLAVVTLAWRNREFIIWGLLLGAPSNWVAEYDDMSCCKKRGERKIDSVNTDLESSTTGCLADLYLRLPDGEVFRVRELTEETTDLWVERYRRSGMPNRKVNVMSSLGIYCGFKDDTLIAFSLRENSKFEIGSSPYGPFHRLPMTYGTMRELFGSDFEWRRYQSRRLW